MISKVECIQALIKRNGDCAGYRCEKCLFINECSWLHGKLDDDENFDDVTEDRNIKKVELCKEVLKGMLDEN